MQKKENQFWWNICSVGWSILERDWSIKIPSVSDSVSVRQLMKLSSLLNIIVFLGWYPKWICFILYLLRGCSLLIWTIPSYPRRNPLTNVTWEYFALANFKSPIITKGKTNLPLGTQYKIYYLVQYLSYYCSRKHFVEIQVQAICGRH